MRRRFALLALGLGLALGASCAPEAPPPSVERTISLDRLYDRLRVTDNDDEAQAIEAAIRHAWAAKGPKAANSLLAYALDTVHSGQVEVAMVIVEKAIEIAPGFTEAWMLRSSLHFHMGYPAQAVEDLAHILAIEPRHFQALANAGFIMLDMGDSKGALKAFDASLAIHPHQPNVKEQADKLRTHSARAV
jgi:tetratricopeptide (TPR) repeat protein